MKRREFLKYSGVVSLGSIIKPTSVYGLDFFSGNSVEKVYLIFKTHLDIGFTNLGSKVIDIYMHEFIPKALSLSESLKNDKRGYRYKWTTGSWLINEFLEKSDASMRRKMETAIQEGDIVWHGLPFTTHSELADPSLFDLGIQLSKRLDKRFGKQTIAAKMTDVPGHTRGIVSILSKNDIQFLHIGVNSASTKPSVPSLFKWQAPDGSTIDVMYQQGYGDQLLLPDKKTVVDIRFTNDNHGPHTIEQISNIYQEIKDKFPNAEIQVTTLNDIAKEISKNSHELPIIQQEIGDTWIHGIGSDPLKIAKFRALSRLRLKWLNEKKINFGDTIDFAFGMPLLMVAEHTWGLDVKTFLKDWEIYLPKDFDFARKKKENFKLMEESWQEKRNYIDQAVGSLGNDMATEAKDELRNLTPKPIDKKHFKEITHHNEEIDTKFYLIRINPLNGSVVKLKDKITGIDWATKDNPLFRFSYQTLNSTDYDNFLNQYLVKKLQWALDDFGKHGLDGFKITSKIWDPVLKKVFDRENDEGHTILVESSVTDNEGNSVGGSPRTVTLQLFFPKDKKEIQVTLNCLNKPAYRLPEVSWFSFIPPVTKGFWQVNKMGQFIKVRDVINNGARNLHANIEGIQWIGEKEDEVCSIFSLDSPLVGFRENNILNFDNRLSAVSDGAHFCLHNNVWGTNFRMWFDDDMQYRFIFKT